MSEHLPPRSSVGSRGSAPSSDHHQQHVTSHPRPHGNPDPLASVWIRRLHLTPNPPPPTSPHSTLAPPPPHEHDTVSNRSAGFGPFRWSPRPQRDAPVDAAPGPPMTSPFFRSYQPQPMPAIAWDATPAPCAAPPMMSPFFRSYQPEPMPAVANVGEFAPVRTAIGFGSSGGGGFAGLSSRAVLHVNPHASWLAATPAAAGSAYPNHAVDMVPIRTPHDPYVRQHSMVPRSIPRPARSSSSQNDEPFSYWNMGRFQRSTTTSSISQVAVAPGNFVKKSSLEEHAAKLHTQWLERMPAFWWLSCKVNFSKNLPWYAFGVAISVVLTADMRTCLDIEGRCNVLHLSHCSYTTK